MDSALQTWREWQQPPRQKPNVVETLSGGHSHKSYRVSDGEQQRVIRLENPASRKLALPRDTEIEIQTLAAKQGLAANIVYIGDNFLVSDYLTGEHWPENPSEQNLQQLGSALRKLHQLAVSDHSFDMASHIGNYWQQLMEKSSPIPEELAQSKPAIEKLLKQFKADSDPVVCHQDLHPGNLLITTTGIKFLDWEYAANNDRYFDLACLCENFSLSDSQRHSLFNHYGLLNIDHHKLQNQRSIARHLESLWWALQA